MTDALKLLFILRIRLDPQTGREHKLPDRSAEAGEEGIERLSGVSPIHISMRIFSIPSRISRAALADLGQIGAMPRAQSWGTI